MRKTLTAAAALAPLWFAVCAGEAWATTTISTGRTTPISTSTANNGAPDDIDIASGGSVTLKGPGPAVTLDSNNLVKNEGTIQATDVNNAIGVLIVGGHTGSFDNTGSIILNDSASAPGDTNADGANEEPFAKGSNRTGVLVQGALPFVGNIVNDTTGLINITGNNSFGIDVQAPLTGDLQNLGSIVVTGDNSIGIRESGGVTGNVLVTGATSTIGVNTSSIVLNGDISGRFSLYGAVSNTGYGTTARSPFNTTQALIQATATETGQAGPAVIVGGSVAGGILIGSQPIGTATGSTADVDGDGIPDGTEGTGSISQFGGAQALLIGAAGQNITIGPVQLVGGTNQFGLIIAGAVSSSGVMDGVATTAVQIGMPGGTVNVAGGADITGSIGTSAFGANATAVHLLSGSTVPNFNVSGSITAVTGEPLPNATTGVATPFSGNATALQIDAGANVTTLSVGGTISAEADGDTNSATAVVDNGGGISTVNLSGHILTTIVPSLSTIFATGNLTALDLHNNVSGVTINMTQAPELITTVVTNADGTSTSTTVTGPVVQNTSGTAVSTSVTSTDGKTTTTTVTPQAPSIIGDVLLGNGNNVLNMGAGIITGALNLGSGTASMTVDNGASYFGALTYTGNALTLNIINGAVTSTNPATLTATSLHVGALGGLSFAIDPLNNKATNFIVNGTATIDAGAKFGVNLLSSLNGPETFTLVKATNLISTAADATLAVNVPFLFFATVNTNLAAGTINLTLRQKTASEMQLNSAESNALPAIYAALSKDVPIQQAIFAQFDRGGFLNLYDQFLPDYSGGLFRAASEASRTISRLTAEPNDIENPTGSRGAWAQQFFVGAEQPKGSTAGFRAGGFGYVGGVETGGMGFGAVGATASFVAINNSSVFTPSDNRDSLSQLEAGLYWQGETGGLILDARVGAGVDFFTGRRQFIETDPTTGSAILERQTKAAWTGYSLTGHFGAAYAIDLTPSIFVRPQVHLDYYRLDEGGYSERLGGDAFNLSYGDRVGDEASGTASMVFGMKLGRGLIWRPELEFGVRDVFAGDAGVTTAHFTSGGQTFNVSPDDITGVGGIARFKLKASSEYYEVGIEAGTEVRSRYAEGDLKMTVRVLF